MLAELGVTGESRIQAVWAWILLLLPNGLRKKALQVRDRAVFGVWVWG
jgi:hypothetical protein